ncbi:MAG: S-layer homology domain-containing protein [Peptoniphilaceae bacterium]
MKKIITALMMIILFSTSVGAKESIQKPSNLSVSKEGKTYILKFKNNYNEEKYNKAKFIIDVKSDKEDWISKSNKFINKSYIRKDLIELRIDDKELSKHLSSKARNYSFRVKKVIDNNTSNYSYPASIGSISIFNNYSDWAYEDLMLAQSYGLFSEDIRKDVKKSINRVEMAELIVKASSKLGFPKVHDSKIIYSDIDNIYTRNAKTLGLMLGISENKFNPSGKVTKEDLAIILDRLVRKNNINSKSNKEIADINLAENYAKNSIVSVVNKNILLLENKKFNPKKNITRQEAIVALVRIVKEH